MLPPVDFRTKIKDNVVKIAIVPPFSMRLLFLDNIILGLDSLKEILLLRLISISAVSLP
jgi:hypothetical protein